MHTQQNMYRKLYIFSFPSNADTAHAFAKLCQTSQQQDTLERNVCKPRKI